MAKFTVYFKDKALSSDIFDAGTIHIGSDESSDIIVDSLAIAPAHAVVTVKEGGCVIKQLNENYPLIINDMPVKENVLQDNDRINIGKHSIVFNNTESVAALQGSQANDKTLEYLNEKLEENRQLPEANLQIMNGSHIGRILALKKTMTRIGNSGSDIAIISRRKNGYYIAALEQLGQLTVNNVLLGEKSIKLNNNDIIDINNTSMQFFCINDRL